MITMQSTWHADPRQTTTVRGLGEDDEEEEQQRRQQQMLLGQLLERSISAPPPAGTRFDSDDFASGGGRADGEGSLLFGTYRQNGQGRTGLQKSSDDFFVDSNLFSSGRDRSSSLLTSTSGSFLFDRAQTDENTSDGLRGSSATTMSSGGGAYSSSTLSDQLLPGMERERVMSNSSSSPQLAGDRRFAFDLDARAAAADGNLIARPKSAAPEFASRTISPPPGMGRADTSGSLLFDTSMSREAIMRAGQRRPASTGVIGQPIPVDSSSSSVMNALGLIHSSFSGGTDRAPGGAVRPAPKTLMELIQEDFPKTSSPEYYPEPGGIQSSGGRQEPGNLSSEEPVYPQRYVRGQQDQRETRYQQEQEPQRQSGYQQEQASYQQEQTSYKQEQTSYQQEQTSYQQEQTCYQQEQTSYQQQQEPPRQNRYQHHQHDDAGRLSQTMNNLHITSSPSMSGGMGALPEEGATANAAPHYVTVPVSQLQGRLSGGLSHPSGMAAIQHHNPQPSGYATGPSGQAGNLNMHSMHGPDLHGAVPHAIPSQSLHHSQYEAQTIFYTTQQPAGPNEPPVRSQMLHPMTSGHHAVYVNTPYGYATVQYHSAHPAHHVQHTHAAPRHVMHSPQLHHVGPSGHYHQEYISVLPIHSSSGTHTGVHHNGSYAYALPQPPADIGTPSSPMLGPTVTVMGPNGPQVAQVTMAAVGTSPGTSPSGGRHRSRGPGNGRSPSERGGAKNKRGDRSSGRRGGASGTGMDHSKHSPVGSVPVASPLLEEFRSAKNREWTANDIKGHIVEFCQDQNGSRFIQQRLEVADKFEKEIVMSEILPSIKRLRNDVFGNYVVQKLLEHGTPEMKAKLNNTLKGEMLALSLQMYGCRVVQKALETLDDDDVIPLLTEFRHNVISCIHDQNGNHVMQKCIEVMCSKAKKAREAGDDSKSEFFKQQVMFIIEDVLDNVAAMACHPYGCRVLQRILEHCVDPEKTRALDDISRCHRTLLDDQYGNYVIQHVLQFGRHSDRELILKIVLESGILVLSRQKFASNVVEKLLKYGAPEQRNALVREMLKVVDENTGVEVAPGESGVSVVLLMVRDAYANYVVQTTLDVVAEGEERRLLLEELNANSAKLRNYTFAKHIVTKLGA